MARDTSGKIPASDEKILRHLAVAAAVHIGTSAPFNLGNFFVKRIGFANIPVVGMVVACRPQDTSAVVPIVRSFVYTELEGAGIPNEAVEFIPTRGETERGGRQTMFVDTNESSPTKGKNKRGQLYEFRFEIKKEFIQRFVWDTWRGKLPEHPGGKEETKG